MRLETVITPSKRELGRWTDRDLMGVKLAVESDSAILEERIFAFEYELVQKMNDLIDIKRMVGKFALVEHKILGRYIEGKTLDEIAI